MAPVPTFEHNCITTLEVGVVEDESGKLSRGWRHRVPSATTVCNNPGRNRPPFRVQSASVAACKMAVRQILPSAEIRGAVFQKLNSPPLCRQQHWCASSSRTIWPVRAAPLPCSRFFFFFLFFFFFFFFFLHFSFLLSRPALSDTKVYEP